LRFLLGLLISTTRIHSLKGSGATHRGLSLFQRCHTMDHNDNPISPLRKRADELASSGLPKEAAQLYQKLVEDHPLENSHLLCLAWALNDSGEKEKAIEAFETLFRRELVGGLISSFALDELVRIHREEKNWEALIAVCRRAEAVQPDDACILRTLGDGCLRAGQPLEAVDVFRKLVCIDPESPEAWGALGGALIAAGNVEEGESMYRRAARLDADAAVAYLDRLAVALARAGRAEQAVACWNECEALQPDSPVYAAAIGELLVASGQIDRAFGAFERAAAIKPSDAGEQWRRLGDMLSKSGQPALAEDAYLKAVDADAQNTLYRLRLASCYAAQGKNEQAAAILDLLKNS
jgi:tetratricopeptide (TPR) repeat protein